MKEIKTPKQLREALWEKAKAIQSAQADVSNKKSELSFAEAKLANALSDFGGLVYTDIPDISPLKENE